MKPKALLFFMASVLFSLSGEIEAMPISPSDTAGAMMNRNLRDMMIQSEAPWLLRPIQENDLISPRERTEIYSDGELLLEEDLTTQGMLKDADGNAYITGLEGKTNKK